MLEDHTRAVLVLDAGISRQRPAVLVVDDDPTARETVGRILRLSSVRVYEADTGAAAVCAARAQPVDLAVIDYRLPDISGLDVARTLGRERIVIPWILMSGWMDVELAVEAMKLGAASAVSLPFDVEAVIMPVLADILKQRGVGWPPMPLTPRLRSATSAAERLACLILKACDAPGDLPTIRHWASIVAASYSALTDSCRVVGVPPHDARDFMRILRALCRTAGRIEHVETELLVADDRTRRALLERAGVTACRRLRPFSPTEFLLAQSFIQSQHPLLVAINRLLADMR